MPPQKVATREEKKTDWLTIGAIGVGLAALGVGVAFWLKKEGVAPGGEFKATIKFDYVGLPGSYVLQVRLGWLVLGEPIAWFNPTAGMKWTLDIDLAGPDSYEFEMICKIPEGADEGTYDAECQVKLPGSDESTYITRDLDDNAIEVKKA